MELVLFGVCFVALVVIPIASLMCGNETCGICVCLLPDWRFFLFRWTIFDSFAFCYWFYTLVFPRRIIYQSNQERLYTMCKKQLTPLPSIISSQNRFQQRKQLITRLLIRHWSNHQIHYIPQRSTINTCLLQLSHNTSCRHRCISRSIAL